MAGLREIAREYRDEIMDGIAWVAIWKEGRSWNAKAFWLNMEDMIEDEDMQEARDIVAADANAIFINEYYCAHMGEGKLEDIVSGIRFFYEQGWHTLEDSTAYRDEEEMEVKKEQDETSEDSWQEDGKQEDVGREGDGMKELKAIRRHMKAMAEKEATRLFRLARRATVHGCKHSVKSREVEMPAEDAVQCPETQEETAASCQEPEKVATSQPEKSAYGLEKTVYPEGSLIAEAGCGHKYDCFSCAQDCGIRQKYRYCMFAPLGNPFGCDRMESLEGIRKEMGERCQFINNSLANHTAGTDEASPCCTECTEECAFRCRRSCRMEADKQQKTSDSSTPEENQEDGIRDELAEMRRIFAAEQKTLNDYLAVAAEDGKFPEKLMFKQKAIVTALSEMLDRMEEAEAEPEPEEREQPPLPPLKNNDRRREWLRSYKDWGLWYRDENIGVDYYKYDFENGACLIAEVYQEEATKYYDAYESFHLHLVGGPEPKKDRNGVPGWQWHGRYTRYPNSETELVEFLKEVQKKGGNAG